MLDEVKVRMDSDTHNALRTAADAKGLSDAELARRLIRRGLALDATSDQSQVLAEAVRYVIREELRTLRRNARTAAFESARAASMVPDALGHSLSVLSKLPRPEIQDRADRVISTGRKHANSLLADEAQEEPPEEQGLPEATDEIKLDAETAAFVAGGSGSLD